MLFRPTLLQVANACCLLPGSPARQVQLARCHPRLLWGVLQAAGSARAPYRPRRQILRKLCQALAAAADAGDHAQAVGMGGWQLPQHSAGGINCPPGAGSSRGSKARLRSQGGKSPAEAAQAGGQLLLAVAQDLQGPGRRLQLPSKVRDRARMVALWKAALAHRLDGTPGQGQQ